MKGIPKVVMKEDPRKATSAVEYHPPISLLPQ
jgi:hypothetical protein